MYEFHILVLMGLHWLLYRKINKFHKKWMSVQAIKKKTITIEMRVWMWARELWSQGFWLRKVFICWLRFQLRFFSLRTNHFSYILVLKFEDLHMDKKMNGNQRMIISMLVWSEEHVPSVFIWKANNFFNW